MAWSVDAMGYYVDRRDEENVERYRRRRMTELALSRVWSTTVDEARRRSDVLARLDHALERMPQQHHL